MNKFMLVLGVVLIAACKSNSVTDASKTEVSLKNLVKVDLRVGGMTCTGCENTISKAVAGLNGVIKCSASHTDSLATVTFDSTLVSLEQISGKITDVGYHVLGRVPVNSKVE